MQSQRVSFTERELLTSVSKNLYGRDYRKIVKALLNGPRPMYVSDFGHGNGATLKQALSDETIMVVGRTNAAPKTYFFTPGFLQELTDAVNGLRTIYGGGLPHLASLKREGVMVAQYAKCLDALASEAGISVQRLKGAFIDCRYIMADASADEVDKGWFCECSFQGAVYFAKTTEGIEYQRVLSERLEALASEERARSGSLGEIVARTKAARQTSREKFERYVNAVLHPHEPGNRYENTYFDELKGRRFRPKTRSTAAERQKGNAWSRFRM